MKPIAQPEGPHPLALLPLMSELQQRVSSFAGSAKKLMLIKARGEGLKVALESFSVSLTPGKPAVLQSSDEKRWSLYSLDPTEDFVGH
jgi:hypothetical protein